MPRAPESSSRNELSPVGLESAAARHWDGVAAAAGAWRTPLWRLQSDTVNRLWLERWLPPAPAGRLLKTDLFDELAGDGLLAFLTARATAVVGIDVSGLAATAVGRRHPAVETHAADVRELPFPDRSFDVVVSNSTLDHLADQAQVTTALGELVRVLRPRGRLIVTLDNPINPFVAVRNALPAGLARTLRHVSYDAGWTCGPGMLRSLLGAAGLEVAATTAIMHTPRTLVALAGRPRVPVSPRWPRLFRAGERLERLPTRYLTGHFVGALAFRTGS